MERITTNEITATGIWIELEGLTCEEHDKIHAFLGEMGVKASIIEPDNRAQVIQLDQEGLPFNLNKLPLGDFRDLVNKYSPTKPMAGSAMRVVHKLDEIYSPELGLEGKLLQNPHGKPYTDEGTVIDMDYLYTIVRSPEPLIRLIPNVGEKTENIIINALNDHIESVRVSQSEEA